MNSTNAKGNDSWDRSTKNTSRGRCRRTPKSSSAKARRSARWHDRKGTVRISPVVVGKDGRERVRVETRPTSRSIATIPASSLRNRPGVGTRARHSNGSPNSRARRTDQERRDDVGGSEDERSSKHADHGTRRRLRQRSGIAGIDAGHVKESRRVLGILFKACGVERLGDLDRSTLEKWLNKRRQDGTSARTRNADQSHAIAFANWCVSVRRLPINPFAGLAKCNEAGDRRRTRRCSKMRSADCSTRPVNAPYAKP